MIALLQQAIDIHAIDMEPKGLRIQVVIQDDAKTSFAVLDANIALSLQLLEELVNLP